MSIESFVKRVKEYDERLKTARADGTVIVNEGDEPAWISYNRQQFIAGNRDELLVALAKKVVFLEKEVKEHRAQLRKLRETGANI